MRRGSPYSSDEFARQYERLAAPHHFVAPARDLVAVLELARGARVLDVGSGTGAAAVPARARVGPAGLVVAMDPQPSMLRRLPRDPGCARVAARAPGLPFADGAFDAVLASFSVSHFSSYGEGLADMVRVLRPGGALALTAWGEGLSAPGRAWRDVAESFAPAAELEQAFREHIPWDAHLGVPGHVERALEEAGLERIEVRTPHYPVAMGLDDFLSIRAQSVEGILLRDRIGPEGWSAFQQRAREALRSRFGARVEYSRAVNLGCGKKPR